MTLFDRQYRFSFGPAGGAGSEIGATTPDSPTAIRINFNIEKADCENPNNARFSLWNLNPQHLAMLNEKDCVVQLRAGYGNHMSLCFTGVITFINTIMDGGDRETILEACDGRVALRDTYVSLSYSGVVSGRTVVNDIAAQMGLAVTHSHNVVLADIPHGFSFVGLGRVGLDKAVASSGAQWQIYNGVLQIKNHRDTMNRQVYTLSAETGLIRIPKRITFSEAESGVGDEMGWEVDYLLNGAIGIGDFVHLDSNRVQGHFRVRSIEMNGDSLQGEWICTARLIEA